MIETAEAANPAVARYQRVRLIALIVGIIALLLSLIGAFVSPDNFFRAYLVGFSFWVSITLGFLFLHLVHNVVGGAWGYVERRFFEAGMALLPLMAVFFLPLLLGLPSLYSWARPEVVANDPLLQHKLPYLNIPFFIIRAIIYFAIWILLAYFMRKWSLDRDRTADPAHTIKMKRLGAGGILLYAITCNFAYFDWLMSLDPHWFSSIYSVTIFVPGVLAAHSFAIIMMSGLIDRPPLAEVIPVKLINDLGNLMLGFVVISMYVAFSQFLIIWMANLPEETIWYIHRWAGGWQWMAAFLATFQFIVPLSLLVSREVKRNIQMLAIIGVGLMFVWLINVYWQVQPNFSPQGIAFHWVDLLPAIGLGGIWIALYIWQLGRRPILPRQIPPLPERYHVGS